MSDRLSILEFKAPRYAGFGILKMLNRMFVGSPEAIKAGNKLILGTAKLALKYVTAQASQNTTDAKAEPRERIGETIIYTCIGFSMVALMCACAYCVEKCQRRIRFNAAEKYRHCEVAKRLAVAI